MALVLALGAYLKNAACLFDSDQPLAAHWSAVHGDLSDPAACMALRESTMALLAQAKQPINAIAHDLHPDFFSTHLALELAEQLGVTAIAVQHHHAHIAAVMAEHQLNRPALGLALDGVGLGSDGTAWGGEVLYVNSGHFKRVGHLLPLALPGSDVAAREPWRMAAAALHSCGLTTQIEPRFGPIVGEQAARTISAMLQRALNCPMTTAAGRWFDAAAGLLGLSVRQTEEAQAAIALEQAAKSYLQGHTLDVRANDWVVTPDGQIDLRPLVCSSLIDVDTSDTLAVAEAAARFHLTLADALCTYSIGQAHLHNIDDVALSGGCFFNRILTQRIVSQLQTADLNVLQAKKLSCGDAGLALGQAWVAQRRMEQEKIIADHTCYGSTASVSIAV